MKRLILILAMLCLVVAPACSSGSSDDDEAENVEAEESDDEESDDEESDDEASDDEESDDEASDDKDKEESDDEESDEDETAAKEEDSKEEEVKLEPGAVPFEFPVVDKLTASEGDYVLTPSRSVLEAYAKEGKGVAIYYTSKVLETGDKETKIKSLAGTEYTMPNAMIIPIRKGEKVKKGDVVLTWWQSGSGMQRAIVTGGSPTEPTVRYLDLKTGDKEDTLKPDSFHKLTTPMEVGSTVACKDGSRRSRGVVTAASGDKLLFLGFAGKMSSRNKADCVGLPVALDTSTIKPGAKVQAPFVGSYAPATVKTVNADTGRVVLTFDGQSKEQEVAFIDVTASLDGSAPAKEAPPTTNNESTTTAKPGEIDINKVKDEKPDVAYGNFRGSVSGGGVSGSIMMSVRPGKLSGNMKGLRSGEKWNTGFSGTVRGATFSGSGTNKSTSLTISGRIAGRRATGNIRGRINGKSASMNFTANR